MASVAFVDDSAHMRHLVRRLVEQAGHEIVAEAASALQPGVRGAMVTPPGGMRFEDALVAAVR